MSKGIQNNSTDQFEDALFSLSLIKSENVSVGFTSSDLSSY